MQLEKSNVRLVLAQTNFRVSITIFSMSVRIVQSSMCVVLYSTIFPSFRTKILSVRFVQKSMRLNFMQPSMKFRLAQTNSREHVRVPYTKSLSALRAAKLAISE